MDREIERKFLVEGNSWKGQAETRIRIRQAYLARTGKAQIRVRIQDDAEAVLTIKSADPDLDRAEFEYDLPLEEARRLLDLCEGECLDKMRYRVPAHHGACWEIDEFAGGHSGLVLAEIELAEADQPFEPPEWLGQEVTGDARYYNAELAGGTSGRS